MCVQVFTNKVLEIDYVKEDLFFDQDNGGVADCICICNGMGDIHRK